MFEIESPSNYEQKCLCVLLLDTSYSMQGSKIDELQKGLEAFSNEISTDPTTSNRLEVSIVSFNSTAEVLQNPSLIDDFEMPQLAVAGTTNLTEGLDQAIDVVEARKAWYKSTGQPYYRPWIILMTDGQPTDESGYPLDHSKLDSLSTNVKSGVENKNFFFFPIGVDGADMDALSLVASSQMPPAKLDGLKFASFFKWLSASMTQVTQSNDGDKLDLPDPSSWMKGFSIT